MFCKLLDTSFTEECLLSEEVTQYSDGFIWCDRCQILLVTNFARVIELFLSPTETFNEKLMDK